MGDNDNNNNNTNTNINSNGDNSSGGKVYTNPLGGYRTYVPNECNSDTKVNVYFPGGGGRKYGDCAAVDKYIQQHPDEVWIVSDLPYGTEKAILNEVDSLSKYGVDNNVNTVGFSAGCPTALKFTGMYVEKNQEAEPQNVVLLDPANSGQYLLGNEAAFATGEKYNKIVENNSTLKALKENNSNVTIVSQNKPWTGYAKTAEESDNINTLANELGATLVVPAEGHNGHMQINDEAFANDVVGYYTGKTDTITNADIYTAKEKNIENNTWNTHAATPGKSNSKQYVPPLNPKFGQDGDENAIDSTETNIKNPTDTASSGGAENGNQSIQDAYEESILFDGSEANNMNSEENDQNIQDTYEESIPFDGSEANNMNSEESDQNIQDAYEESILFDGSEEKENLEDESEDLDKNSTNNENTGYEGNTENAINSQSTVGGGVGNTSNEDLNISKDDGNADKPSALMYGSGKYAKNMAYVNPNILKDQRTIDLMGPSLGVTGATFAAGVAATLGKDEKPEDIFEDTVYEDEPDGKDATVDPLSLDYEDFHKMQASIPLQEEDMAYLGSLAASLNIPSDFKITDNTKMVYNHMQRLKNIVRATDSKLPSFSVDNSSACKLLPAVDKTINGFLNSIREILESIINETENVIKVALTYDELDRKTNEIMNTVLKTTGAVASGFAGSLFGPVAGTMVSEGMNTLIGGESTATTEGTTETQAEGTTETQTEGTTETQTEGETETQAEGTTETQTEGTTETQTEGETETQAEGETETQAEGTTETQTEGTTETQAEGTTETQAEGTTETQAEGTTETQAEGTTETQAEGTTETQTEGTTETQTEGETETQAEGETETQTEGTTETQTEGTTETQTEGETETQTEGEPEIPTAGEPIKPTVGEPETPTSGEPEVPTSGEPETPPSEEPTTPTPTTTVEEQPVEEPYTETPEEVPEEPSIEGSSTTTPVTDGKGGNKTTTKKKKKTRTKSSSSSSSSSQAAPAAAVASDSVVDDYSYNDSSYADDFYLDDYGTTSENTLDDYIIPETPSSNTVNNNPTPSTTEEKKSSGIPWGTIGGVAAAGLAAGGVALGAHAAMSKDKDSPYQYEDRDSDNSSNIDSSNDSPGEPEEIDHYDVPLSEQYKVYQENTPEPEMEVLDEGGEF